MGNGQRRQARRTALGGCAPRCTSLVHSRIKIARAVKHERGYAHGGQHVAHVDPRVHLDEGACGARAGGGASARLPPPGHRFVRARAHAPHVGPERPLPLDLLSVREPLLLGRRPRVILGAQPLGIRAVEHEFAYPFRSRGREQDRQWAALRVAEDGRPLPAYGVHDGADVIHPSLEVRQPAGSVRESGAALVESDQASERAEAIEKVRRAGIVPVEFEVRDKPGTSTRSSSPSPVTW